MADNTIERPIVICTDALPSWQDHQQRILSRAGFDVITAKNVQGAMDAVAQLRASGQLDRLVAMTFDNVDRGRIRDDPDPLDNAQQVQGIDAARAIRAELPHVAHG